MLRSLWFRLTGTVVGLVLFTMALSLGATFLIAGRQIGNFIENTSDQIIEITAPTELIIDDPNIEVPIDPASLHVNENELGGITVRNGPNDLVEINPGGSVNLNTDNPSMSQINVQIPQIVQTESSKLARNLQNTFLSTIGVTTLLAIIAATWLFWQITRPLSRLRVAADQIASGNLETRVLVKSKDEVGRVGLAFNHMAGELHRQEGLRKQMVADIAHELRTPLTVMQANLEAMADELLPASPEELGGLHHEVIRLSRLVEDLRVLSLADAGKLQMDAAPLDMNQLAESAVRRLKPQADSLGVLLTASTAPKPAIIMGDEGKLQQVLANLISNSLRYTPAGNQVTLSVTRQRKHIILSVTDQGSGINPDNLPGLFERFYKGDRARSRNESGSGLGLSIVKQLVELHNGTIEAALPKSGGLQIKITLPSHPE